MLYPLSTDQPPEMNVTVSTGSAKLEMKPKQSNDSKIGKHDAKTEKLSNADTRLY